MQPLRIVRARRAYRAVSIALFCLAYPADAQNSPTPDSAQRAAVAGDYVHSERELVAGIRLNPDGTFQYGLTVGSLDERAQGRWRVSGNRIEFTSDPRPVAPTITPGKTVTATGEPFALRVLTPNGGDMPGVDLLLEFDSGEPLESYMAGHPWTLPPEEARTPKFVTFSMPSYRLRSERLPLEARPGTITTFILTPNDFGVADLTGTHADLQDGTLTLHRPEGSMMFKRSSE